MSKLRLSMASAHYDHLHDLVSGRVRVEGIELTPMVLPVEEIFFRTLSYAEWDIAEFSFAKYVALTASGKAAYRALPVFPSRVFRQSAFYVATTAGIDSPQDLRGQRLGVPEWSQTAGVYARGYLQHQCGVDLREIEWVQAGVNQPGRQEKVSLDLPPGIRVRAIPDRSLNEMLLAGEIDAILSAREPEAFRQGDSRIRRLWEDFQPVEEEYWRSTGIFPIMHVMVVKKDVLEQASWAATNLLNAFEESRRNSVARFCTVVNSAAPVPWLYAAFERAQRVFGKDPWPYGIEPNRTTLAAFLQFCHEQGVTQRPLRVEELFPSEVQTTVRV